MNITDDYNDTLTTNITDNYNDTLSPIFAIIENNFDIMVPTLFLTIPCGLSFPSLMSLMVYSKFKLLLTK